MAKNVLIFFSYKKHKTGYYDKLFEPLKMVESSYGLILQQGSLKDLYIEIIENKLLVTEPVTQKTLDEFDYVRFELWLKAPQQALAAATYLNRRGIPFSSHEALNTLCTTKIGEMVRMSDCGLPLPRTFMSSHDGIKDRFKNNPPIGYPLITKAADTFGGKMNFLVKNFEELKAAISHDKNQFFLIQEFIPNSFDYRIVVMDNQIKFVLKRTRSSTSGSHLNNTSAGAEGVFVPINELSEIVQADALKAAEMTLRSDFAGVDIIFDSQTGQHYILEVNEAPEIQTGANPPFKIASLMDHISQKAHTKGAN